MRFMPLHSGDYQGLRKVARPYLSKGKTILEIGTGDNTGPFYALYPLIHPNGLYIGTDTQYTEEMFRKFIVEDNKVAVNSGLVDKTFSPYEVNLRYLPVDGQSEKIPSGFDLALGNELIGYLLYAGEMIPVLENLSRKKNPNARLILFERVYPTGFSDLDLAKTNNRSIREICHQFLDSIEEGRTLKGYDYLIGKL